MSFATVAIGIAAVLAILFIARALTKSKDYPPVELSELDVDALRRLGEELLTAADAWPSQLTAPGVDLATSVEPFDVRCVLYTVDVRGDFETAVAHVKNLCDCGTTNRKSEDKFEETLYDKNRGGTEHAWVRRSVHISPPPGSNRDAVVVYCEDRPDPKTYRVAFRSVDSIDGQPISVYERASRFMVNPAMFKVEELEPGRVRIRKVEAVDPQGMVSPLLNNYFISLMFFRKYMFEEAKAMHEHIAAAAS